ncbi:MAG: nitrile hydratase subunit beta [Beijerinckiaceae bacterium]
MNGAQDLGGAMGFGPVRPESDEPYFHADWERRVLALTLAMGATSQWNIDMSRHARETLHPADYLSKSYYDVWISGLEKLLETRGLASREEMSTGKASQPPRQVARILRGDDVEAALARGGPCDRPMDTPARYKAGDRVRTRVEIKTGHTRLPRYARGKLGIIERVHGGFVFPDANAHGEGEQPQWVYTVCFEGRELWGPQSDAALAVSIDAWESYLDPA